jgi:hypothetical protein
LAIDPGDRADGGAFAAVQAKISFGSSVKFFGHKHHSKFKNQNSKSKIVDQNSQPLNARHSAEVAGVQF